MTTDRDYWKNLANGKMSFKTMRFNLSDAVYSDSDRTYTLTFPHGCGTTPKYVFVEGGLYSTSYDAAIGIASNLMSLTVRTRQRTTGDLRVSFNSVNIILRYNPYKSETYYNTAWIFY
jgi:hypothetical protein